MRRLLCLLASILLAHSLTGSPPFSFFSVNRAQAQAISTTAGWSQLANTKIRDVCASTHGFSQVSGVENCFGILSWSGGVFDTTRNRLLVHGGGHGAYLGNEWYALNLNANPVTMTRLDNPGLPVASSCQEAIAGGSQANSRHTYDGIEYMPNIDKVFVFSGSLACDSGQFGQWAWLFNLQTLQWENIQATIAGPHPNGDAGMLTAYNPNDGKVYVHDRSHLFSYTASTNTWAQLSSEYVALGYHLNAAIDPVRNLFVIAGFDSANAIPAVYTYSLAKGSNYTITLRNTSGGSAIIGQDYIGLDYDAAHDRMVAWNGGNTVYSLNLDSNVWTPTTFAGGPAAPSASGRGTHGRWRYSQPVGALVLVNEFDQDAWIFRFSSGGGGGGAADTTPPSVPSNVSASAASTSQINLAWTASTDNVGVVGYRVYRNGTQVGTPTGTSFADTGLAENTTYNYTVDARDAAGNASSKSAVVSATTQTVGAGGSDFQARCSAAGVLVCMGFDSASDFNIATWPASGLYKNGKNEIRGTMDTTTKASGAGSLRFEIVSNSDSDVAGSWRQDSGRIFGENSTFYVQYRQRLSPEMLSNNWASMGTWWKQAIIHGADSTCSDVELTTNNQYNNGIPFMYTDCGARGIVTNNGLPPYLLQQGDYNCPYGNINPTNCFYYVPNEWVTWYYRISIGTWGGANSTIQAWVAREGQPYKQWVNMSNFTLYNQGLGTPYGFVTLTPYMTAKNTNISHPTAYTWYDELIISTQPIVAPGRGSNPAPAAPTNLRIQ